GARESLSRAISMNGQLQEAYYNRARIAIKRAFDENWTAETAVEDIRQAIRLGAHSSKLYLDGAYICARACRRDQSLVEQGLAYLREAIVLGEPASQVEANASFAAFAEDPRFADLISSTFPAQAAKRHVPLVAHGADS